MCPPSFFTTFSNLGLNLLHIFTMVSGAMSSQALTMDSLKA